MANRQGLRWSSRKQICYSFHRELLMGPITIKTPPQTNYLIAYLRNIHHLKLIRIESLIVNYYNSR